MRSHIMYLYRICNKINKSNTYKRYTLLWIINKIFLKIVYKYYSSLLSLFYGAYLPFTASIGTNLTLNHSFHGIFISENAIIGDNCILIQHTTIGSNQPLSSEAPHIGHNVFIGVNCSIIGKTIIEDNCIIGAGTVISNSFIKKGSIVVGSKYKILNKDNNV